MATAVSAAVCWAVWSKVPRTLTGQTDIVGFPTAAAFNYKPPFWAYRLALYAFPLLLIGCYALLARFGPLRRRGGPMSPKTVELVEPAAAADDPGSFGLSRVLRLVLPVAVILVAIRTRPGFEHWELAAVIALIYVAAVVAAGLLYWRVMARRPHSGATTPWHGLALANGVGGAAAALLGLWFVSRHTTVRVDTVTHVLPWMPLWLAVLGIAIVVGVVWQQVRRGAPVLVVERMLLIGVVGSAWMFLMMSRLPGQITGFEGFDDAQELAGASYLSRGEVPWRDFLFIHGLFPDGLRGTISFAVFGDSIWASWAGSTALLTPLFWVFVYLFAAWVSKGSAWFLALFAVCSVSGYLLPLELRFILVPLVLILLGETLRRRSGLWCVGLIAVLFVAAVLVPEMSFLVLAVLACVVASDVVHQRQGEGIWKTMRRTRWCIATGAILAVVAAAVLAAFGALGGFIDYYVVFGPGHDEAGAIPEFGITPLAYTLWYASLGAVLLTIWDATARIRRRADWQPRDWVALAAAVFVALYGVKALGRFDMPHVGQVVTVALPLLVLWVWKILRSTDALVDLLQSRRWTPVLANALTIAALATVVSTAYDPLEATARTFDTRHRTAAATDSLYPRVGYSTTNAVDPVMLQDLDAAISAYAGRDQPVFDMTNALGYVYYLLGRDAGTRFLHVSMAVPPYAQQLLIDDLKRSQPPVVIFDSFYMGLPAWDGIDNTVRHYQVSQYILDNWVPVLRTHGNLLLVRRDLAAQGRPIPSLAETPRTQDLWFSGRTCGWGAAPNFLQSQPMGDSTKLTLGPARKAAVVDITGWAIDPTSRKPAQAVLMLDGDKVVATAKPTLTRPDVAAALRAPSSISGFHFSGVYPEGKRYKVYMLGDDGKAYPLKGSIRHDLPTITLQDGRVVPTAEAIGGVVDTDATQDMTISQIQVPAGANLAGYDLATVSTGGTAIGDATVTLTDSLGDNDHYISARSLSDTGRAELPIRVGSCLQWQGYDSAKPLYLLQNGGTQVTTVTLSAVKD
ncbi:hypothetical protein GCM10010532_018180 [Dactylosporangium siamense]|uniref:Uncharacterized protein n=1 Tax=Dactylosporangium siamense TaxID=685454 RepID=A0A919PSG7_9ACTN|nr:hypothetical protein Dsi01nite_065720 [Dactylosporangium siamense]